MRSSLVRIGPSSPLMPAQAGIQFFLINKVLGPRFCGDERKEDIPDKHLALR